jgi:hypothetical protein
MFSVLILAISIVALAQFGAFYWRAVVVGIAAQPVSEQVLAAANLDTRTLRGEDYRSLAQLHKLTLDICAKSSGLGLVPLYCKIIHATGKLASGRITARTRQRARSFGALHRSSGLPSAECQPSASGLNSLLLAILGLAWQFESC